MAREWFTQYVDRLREAAEVSVDDADFFTATANALEGGRRVACLDEALTYADRAIAAVRQ